MACPRELGVTRQLRGISTREDSLFLERISIRAASTSETHQ
jgi:hypothetical protein